MSAPYHPLLVWPKSDGDESRCPDMPEPRDEDNYFEVVPPTDPKYTLYELRTAEHLVKELNLPVPPAQQRISMPPGYKLYAHRKRQPGGETRTDFYLYGSIHTAKFRSVPEFYEHAVWLFDRDKSTDDHSTCTCKYSKGGNRRQSVPGTAARRSSASSPMRDGSAKKKKVLDDHDDEQQIPVVVPERYDELTSQRRFRRGELVWFSIPIINPPAGKDLSPITHWPGLIANVPLKVKTLNADDTASASASSAWTLFGGQAPARLESTTQIVQYYEYHIRPLGMFAPSDEVIRDTKDLLPWAVGNELLGGEKGWDAIGYQAEEILVKGIKQEAVKEKIKVKEGLELEDLGKGWKASWAKRIKFVDMPKTWDNAIFRIGLALKTASRITTSWAQTDKIDVLPEDSDISAEDMKAIQEQKKTLYQGLWWGGEKIWLEDMVRMKKHRDDLPSDSLLPPSDGARDRGVFLRIRVISIEVVPSAPKSNQTAWRCVLYGDVFELANEGTDGTSVPKALVTGNTGSDSKHIPVVPAYRPVKGYAYRQLNDPGSEVMCDIIDVAGRVYHDLLDATTQTYFIDPSKPGDKEGRRAPGESALALTGLKPGTTVASKSVDWDEDLYEIVRKSNKETETQMKAYYVSLLRREIGLPPLPAAPAATNGQALTVTNVSG